MYKGQVLVIRSPGRYSTSKSIHSLVNVHNPSENDRLKRGFISYEFRVCIQNDTVDLSTGRVHVPGMSTESRCYMGTWAIPCFMRLQLFDASHHHQSSTGPINPHVMHSEKCSDYRKVESDVVCFCINVVVLLRVSGLCDISL